MASIHIRFGDAMGAGAPVYAPLPSASEKVTSSATSAASAVSATGGDFATISAVDGSVFITIGQTPVALASGSNMDVVLSGQTKDFGPLKPGDKVAVIDV